MRSKIWGARGAKMYFRSIWGVLTAVRTILKMVRMTYTDSWDWNYRKSLIEGEWK